MMRSAMPCSRFPAACTGDAGGTALATTSHAAKSDAVPGEGSFRGRPTRSSPPGTTRSQPGKRGREIAIAGKTVFIGEPEIVGCGLRLPLQFLVFLLAEIDQLAVIAEIHLLQVRMPVEAERFDDEGLELAGEEV